MNHSTPAGGAYYSGKIRHDPLQGAGEILEFDVTEHTKILGVPLSECKMPHDSVIGVCIRGGKPIFPGGDFVAQVGDRLVVFSLPTAVQKVEEILVS